MLTRSFFLLEQSPYRKYTLVNRTICVLQLQTVNTGGHFMGKIFKDDASVLVNDDPIGNEFHLCECGYEECRPTKPYEFIPIDYWVIHYCISGEGFFQILDKQNHIHPGDIFMIPPHTRNKYYPDAKNPWSYRWIGLRGTNVKKVLARCGLSPEHYVIHHKVDPQLESLFEKVYDHFQKDHELMALGSAYYLLDYLSNNVRNARLDHLSPGELYFHSVLNYIHKNYFNNITVSDIAAAANIDRTYVFKLFQKYMDMSPSQYLQHYRLDKACVLLRKSSLSITDIGYAVGFQHSPYFTKLFTQYMGVTPSEYRKEFMQFGGDDNFSSP